MSKEQIDNLSFKYVNGLNLSVIDNSNLSVSSGQCRDSLDNMDIILPANKMLNLLLNGKGGLDAGVVAANTCYNILIIADSAGFNSPDVIASLSASNPSLPAGYDIFRRIGFAPVDGSSYLYRFKQTGENSEKFYIFNDQITVLIGGISTVFVPVDLSTVLPQAINIEAKILASFIPAAAGDVAYIRAGSTISTSGQYVVGQAAGVMMVGIFDTVAKASVDYKVSAGAATISVMGARDSL